MSESIVEELASENLALREENKKLKEEIKSLKEGSVKELSSENMMSYSGITLLSKEGKKLIISGILLAEGVWNGAYYSKEEIKKMFDRYKDELKRLPITVEHEHTEEFKDKEVGKHIDIEWDDMLGAIKYKAEITDPRAIELIENGVFNATSMKLEQRRIMSGGTEIAIDYRPINNSLTKAPACHSCVIVGKDLLSSNSNFIPERAICYFGVAPLTIETNNKDNSQLNCKEDDNMSKESKELESSPVKEYFELSEPMVLVLPEEKEEPKEEEIELELMPLAQALKRKRVIYEYLPPGTYPVTKKVVKRIPGYYYYYPQYGYYPIPYSYPVPYYYWYPVYYGYGYGYPSSEPTGPRTDKERLIAHYGKEVAEKLLELIGEDAYKLLPPRGSAFRYWYPYPYPNPEDLEVLEEDENYKIVKNKKTGKYILMERTGEEGFGAWRIVKQFDTEKEAREYIASLKLEEAAKSISSMAKVKCPICGEEFEDEKSMLEHVAAEHPDEYGDVKEAQSVNEEEEEQSELAEENKDSSSKDESVDRTTQEADSNEESKEEGQPKEDSKATEESKEEEEAKTEESKDEKEEGKAETESVETKEEEGEQSKEEESSPPTTTGKESKEEPKAEVTKEEPKKPSVKEILERLKKEPDLLAELLIEMHRRKMEEQWS